MPSLSERRGGKMPPRQPARCWRYIYLRKFCGAFICLNIFLSNRSPPLGLTTAVTALPPRLYVKRYSPPACFCGRPASTNRNNPQLPGNFRDELEESVVVAGGDLLGVLTFELDEFAEEDVPDVEVVPPVPAKLIKTPVSTADPAGNVPFIEPVPSEVVFWPSIETSISAAVAGRNVNSYSNFGVGLEPNKPLRRAIALFR